MKRWLRRTFHILQWLPSYNKEQFRGDISAGITTGVMFIPQAMAYAVIAGIPPIYGLYAGVIPLLIYPLIGASRNLSVGPVAIDMLIVGSGIGLLAIPETSEYITLAIVLTLMTGAIQLVMGIMRLGSIFNFFSRPVIAGFTLAAPIIISATQLHNFLGIELPNTQFIITIIDETFRQLPLIHVPTLIWSASALALMFISKYFFPKFPISAVILFGSILIAWYFDAEEMGIHILGSIPHGFPSFNLPEISLNNVRQLLQTSMTLALVQFMTIASLGRTFAKKHKTLFDSNQELVAVGASNFIGSFFRSIPISVSFSRSAAADQSNGMTPFMNIITALIIIATLFFLTPLFYYLPLPALAAIIIVSVLNLINFGELKELFNTKRTEGLIAVFTAISTIILGIQEGILLGVSASMINILYKYTRPNVAELGVIPGTRLFKDIARNQNAQRIRKVLILRVDASFSFVNADFFRDFILEKSREQVKDTKYIIIDGSTINQLDTTAVEELKLMISTLRDWDMDLYITGLKGPVRDIIRNGGIHNYLGEDHFFREPHEAAQYLLKIMDEENNESRLDDYHDVVE